MTNLAVLLTPDLQTFFNDFSARIYSSDIPTSLFIPLTPPNGKLMIQHCIPFSFHWVPPYAMDPWSEQGFSGLFQLLSIRKPFKNSNAW
ncbi:hypothetical protein Y032_0017g3473 [Ancylostoma ceylanicum]|uniref:Uncharacterized protein n=1 Tax=Ancylostoma ceylanicum TaxID=53326 RepID=A0A016V4R4_9BILA|nr:hypothetical protein Y032_0017g3473 [Ancylostoma ceylanicum]